MRHWGQQRARSAPDPPARTQPSESLRTRPTGSLPNSQANLRNQISGLKSQPQIQKFSLQQRPRIWHLSLGLRNKLPLTSEKAGLKKSQARERKGPSCSPTLVSRNKHDSFQKFWLQNLVIWAKSLSCHSEEATPPHVPEAPAYWDPWHSWWYFGETPGGRRVRLWWTKPNGRKQLMLSWEDKTRQSPTESIHYSSLWGSQGSVGWNRHCNIT